MTTTEDLYDKACEAVVDLVLAETERQPWDVLREVARDAPVWITSASFDDARPRASSTPQPNWRTTDD